MAAEEEVKGFLMTSDLSPPDDAFARAVAAHEAGDFEAAQAAYSASAAKGSTEAAYQLGGLFADLGQHDAAAGAYRQAAAGGDVDAALELASVLWQKLDREDEAVRVYKDLIASGEKRGFVGLGRLHLRRGFVRDAEIAFRAGSDAGDQAALEELGLLLDHEGRFEEALACFRRVEGAELLIARELIQLQEFAAAETLLTDPAWRDDPEGTRLLGYLLHSRLELDSAEAAYRLAIDRGSLAAFVEYGDLLSDIPGRGDDAIRAYLQGVEAGDRRGHRELARLYRAANQPELAAREYEASISAGDHTVLDYLESLRARSRGNSPS